MATFRINSYSKNNSGFYTDDNLKTGNRNNVLGTRNAEYAPRSDKEIFKTEFDYQKEFGNSISEMTNVMEDMDNVTQNFYELTGIKLGMNDYVPEVDDNFQINTHIDPQINAEMNNIAGGSVKSYAQMRAKMDYINNYIEDYFKKHPDERGGQAGGFKDYSYYHHLRKLELLDLEKERSINQQYNDGSTFIPTALGEIYGRLFDPLTYGYAAASFVAPSVFGVNSIVRTAALEGAISIGFEGAKQSIITPYRQSLGSKYSWKDASLYMGMAGIGGFGGTIAIGYGMKGLVKGFKKVFEALPIDKSKQIAKEIDRLIDEAPAEDEMYADRVLEYIQKQISNLSLAEKKLILDDLPKKTSETKHTSTVIDSEEMINEEMPFKSTPDAELEHRQRLNQAGRSILLDEAPPPDSPLSEIAYDRVLDTKNKPLREQCDILIYTSRPMRIYS